MRSISKTKKPATRTNLFTQSSTRPQCDFHYFYSILILEYVRHFKGHRYLQVAVSDELSEAKGVLIHVTGRKALWNLEAF
jgi:hypothetical protein